MADELNEIEKIKEQNELRRRLIGTSAHSLRSALVNIKWTIEMILAGDMGSISPEQEDYFKKLLENSAGALNLVNDLLNISHAEELQEKVEKQEIDLVLFVDKIINQFTGAAHNKKIKINFAREDMPKITTESKKIEIILINLLDNALRYTHEGTISINLKKETDFAQISVKDTGIGIPTPDQAKVFDKFFRSDNAKKKEQMGTGLGLYISKLLIEGMGGKIWFESQENKGSTF